jgi:hypothetical protein
MQRIVNLNKKLEATDPDLEKQIEINRKKKEKEDAERRKRNDDVARAYQLPKGAGTKKPPPTKPTGPARA